MTLLAIDGDSVAYRMAAGLNEESLEDCLIALEGKLEEILRDTGASQYRIYIGGDNNFRYDIAVTKPYKGNRKDTVKPIHLQACFDYLRKSHRAITVHGYEADDAIASDMVQNDAIHVGVDKDLHQIAGKHYNYVKKEMLDVTKGEATLNLYRQMLTGDSCDNIMGLQGIGDIKAARIISNAATAPDDARQAYRGALGDGAAVYWKEMAGLILLRTDLDIENMMTNSVNMRLV